MVSGITVKTGVARIKHIHSMAETLSHCDLEPNQYLEELLESNAISCDPPLTDAEVKDIARRHYPRAILAWGFDLPEVIVTDKQLRDMTAETMDLLYYYNQPPIIFRRSGGLARVNLDEQGRPYIEMLNESAFRGILARCCNFVRASSKNGTIAISPPLDIVRDCLSLGDWKFPPLLGITESPVMRPDGSILCEPGYDNATQLYYYPDPKLDMPEIPEEPSKDNVDDAIALVMDPLADFPFDNDASLGNAVGTLLTPIVRPMIEGPIPLAIFTKPQQGTGASLLAEVISIVATGRAAAMMAAQNDDEAWRKVITSILIKGQLVVAIDNVEHALWAPSLAAILTATTYQDRILGRSEVVQLPNRATWLATGNNIKLRGDLPRRCIWVKMDARMARPWLRDRNLFKYPQLTEWVSANRGKILAAALTLVRAWVLAGRRYPEDLPTLGNYESWCRVIGGILSFIGVKGFLSNLDAMYDEADSETPQWEGFLEAWQEYIGREAVTAAELIASLNSNAEFKAMLPDSLLSKDGRDYNRRLGNALAKKSDVQFPNGLSITRGAKKKHQAVTWQIASEAQKGS